MKKRGGPDRGGPDRGRGGRGHGRAADPGGAARVIVLHGRPPPARGGPAGRPGGGGVDRLWRPTRHPESLAELDGWLEEQLALALADQVAHGSLYLWTDGSCRVGFRLDEPADAIGQAVPLGELLEQAVYRNLPPDPRHREGYRFAGRGLAEMRALRAVLAGALALIDRHLPAANGERG